MPQNVIITASEAPDGGLEALAKRLEQAGLRVDKVYPYGVITGNISSTQLDALRTMKDVLEVKAERTFKLAPPDSPIQ